jgi:probable rRNA maturation factor
MPTSVLRRAPGSPALLPSVVRRIADAMLVELGLEQAELSVLLTNDRQIHALNLQHRDKDRPTDVLAFPLADASERASGAPGSASPFPVFAGNGVRWLGDVVISLDTAARQARGRKRELLPEVRFLLAHGLLHLVGYDHGTALEKRAMDAMTRRLVRAVESIPTNPHKSGAPFGSRALATPSSKQVKRAKRPRRAPGRHAK